MSVWAFVADVEAVYEGDVPDRAAAMLDRAETLLKRLVPTIADRIEDETLDAELVRLVLVDAVIRSLRNPRGYQWEREGDYSYGMPLNVGRDGGTGGVSFLDVELERLRPSAGPSVSTIPLGDPYKTPVFQRYSRPLLTDWTDDPLRNQRFTPTELDGSDNGTAV